MIVHVVLHEVQYPAHTDGFEKKEKNFVSTS
jgi:hypothetical protein